MKKFIANLLRNLANKLHPEVKAPSQNPPKKSRDIKASDKAKKEYDDIHLEYHRLHGLGRVGDAIKLIDKLDEAYHRYEHLRMQEERDNSRF